jgi:nucleoporin NUP82
MSLREYDTSVDPDEPQQSLCFVPERKNTSFMAYDIAARETASFTFGKGKADWGPLTVYVVMKSGDVYAVCPYLPVNSSVPSDYVHSLECFISAKVEYLDQSNNAADLALSTLYERQHLYIKNLVQQLPPGTVYPAATRSISLHPPSVGALQLQGPFLLQPDPRTLTDSEGGDATDLTYLSPTETDDNSADSAERLGMVLIAYQDGKVDVCLDVDKVEARWESRQVKRCVGLNSRSPPLIRSVEEA